MQSFKTATAPVRETLVASIHMKLRHLIIFIFSLGQITVQSQNLSTIFIDTLRIILNNDTIINSTTTKPLFVRSDQEIDTLLINGTYKIVLENVVTNYYNKPRNNELNKEKYTFITNSHLNLYKNDTLIEFKGLDTGAMNNGCGTYYIMNEQRNWVGVKPGHFSCLTSTLRIINMAPADTASYRLNYKEGIWIGKEENIDKVLITFKNDKKDGRAEVHYRDGSIYQTNFSNNKEMTVGVFNYDNVNRKKKLRWRTMPELLTDKCIDK